MDINLHITFMYNTIRSDIDIDVTEDGVIQKIHSVAGSIFHEDFSNLVEKKIEELEIFLKQRGATSVQKIECAREVVFGSCSSKERLAAAYGRLKNGLKKYVEDGKLGKGALMVQVIGIEGASPICKGRLSASDGTMPNAITVARTGSGSKLWSALLSKCLENKYPQFFRMSDGFGKFVPKETLKKFRGIDLPIGHIAGEDLAKELSVQALLNMTGGLEYEDKGPKRGDEHEGSELSLDELLRGASVIKDEAIRFIGHPRDRVYWYTNNICLIALPIEKAYKKVLAQEYCADKSVTVGGCWW